MPLALNIIVIYGANLILVALSGKSMPNLIMSFLTPAISGVDNVWMFMGIYLFSNILWMFGINGSSIVFPIVFALGIANTGLNGELVNLGKEPTAIMNLQMFRYALLGGAGNTLGLVLLMCRSKSKHISSIGRLSIVPGICGINEPIMFGAPIVLNPIMFIPFVFVPVINAIIGYFATSWGLVNHLVVLNSGVEPIFVNAWVLGAFTLSPVILCIVLFILDLVLYYPFVKLQIKQKTLEAQNEGATVE